MNKQYVIGIDNGTQSTKVTIFDLDGNEISYGSCKLQETVSPKKGYVLHPDEDLWDSVKIALKRSLESFKGDRKSILAIGLCTIRSCRVLLKEDMTLAYPVMNWMDIRLSKPYKHTNDDVKYVTTTSGYLANRLTDEKKDTAGNYEFNWPLDKNTWNWSDDPNDFKACGLRPDMLFDLVLPGEKLGYLKNNLIKEFGFKEKLPVIASSNDKAVEVLASGALSEKSLVISLGTYISALLPKNNNFENANNFFPTLSSIPYKFVYESQGIRRGMWTISWIKDVLGNKALKDIENIKDPNLSVEDLLNEKAKTIPPGSDGLITILDWLSTPDKPYRKGTMIGFDNKHGKFHIYRSILEAIAYNIKNNVDNMLLETGDTIDNIVAIGGGSNSDVLLQILSDLFGIKVQRNNIQSGAALGSAICTYVYLEKYKSFEDAVQKIIKSTEEFLPNQDNHILYNNINNKIIKNIRNYTDPLLKNMDSVFNKE